MHETQINRHTQPTTCLAVRQTTKRRKIRDLTNLLLTMTAEHIGQRQTSYLFSRNSYVGISLASRLWRRIARTKSSTKSKRIRRRQRARREIIGCTDRVQILAVFLAPMRRSLRVVLPRGERRKRPSRRLKEAWRHSSDRKKRFIPS